MNREQRLLLEPLLNALCDGYLSDGDRETLEFHLRDDPEARRLYLAFMAQHAALSSNAVTVAAKMPFLPITIDGSASDEHTQITGASSRKRVWRTGLTVAAGLAAAAVFAVWLFPAFLAPQPQIARDNRNPPEKENRPSALARLEGVTGAVTVVDAMGTSHPIMDGDPIGNGETIVVGNREHGVSGAEVVYTDGSRLILADDTAVTVGESDDQEIKLVYGSVAGDASAQTNDRPLRFVTPEAVVPMTGAKMAMDRYANRTNLGVVTGKVRILSPNPQGRGKPPVAVDLVAGQRVSLGTPHAPKPHQAAKVPDNWRLAIGPNNASAEDEPFGRLIVEDLPPGLTAALRAVEIGSSPSGKRYAISSPNAWTRGLFAMHINSMITIQFKVDQRCAVHIKVGTRVLDPTVKNGAVNFLGVIPPEMQRPGEWRTIRLPLVQFRAGDPKQLDHNPRVAYRVELETRILDGGLTVGSLDISRP